MKKFLIATRNRGKFLEIKEILKNFPFEFFNLDEVPKIPRDFEVKETGESFEENAVLKAKVYGRMAGFLTLADDSGLEVEALDGRPGIYSSRYAKGTDEGRYLKLLKEMRNIPDEKRRAQFRCVVAVYDPQTEKLIICEGICQGKIVKKPKGAYGFGYDPVFYLPQLGKTMAQLKPEEKSSFSHRGKALKKVKEFLKNLNGRD